MSWISAHQYMTFKYTVNTFLPSCLSEEDGSAFFTEPKKRDIKK